MIRSMVTTAMLAALTYAATVVIRIPTPTGGYVNLGDAVVLLAAFLVAGKVTGHESFFAMGVGPGVLFSLSAALEIGTFVYYESRN